MLHFPIVGLVDLEHVNNESICIVSDFTNSSSGLSGLSFMTIHRARIKIQHEHTHCIMKDSCLVLNTRLVAV